MTTLHFGYERQTEEILRARFGDSYLGFRFNATVSVPYAEHENFDLGMIERTPIRRRAIIIEGEAEELASILEALQKLNA